MALNSMDDVCFHLSEHSHWRHVPVGANHQADLPDLASQASDDKWLGTCVALMPGDSSDAIQTQNSRPMIACGCDNSGSIRCVRVHAMAAREELSRALGREKFVQIGFADMGEAVARMWTEEEENLFHEVVLSNPASLGRNFWDALVGNFPSRSFKELVSYYFNVFILRKRAHQNRINCLSPDSDNDEWQESSDFNFTMSSGGGEEEEEEYREHLVGTEEDEAAVQTLNRNSACFAGDDQDGDIQDDSYTSCELVNGFARQGFIFLAEYEPHRRWP